MQPQPLTSAASAARKGYPATTTNAGVGKSFDFKPYQKGGNAAYTVDPTLQQASSPHNHPESAFFRPKLAQERNAKTAAGGTRQKLTQQQYHGQKAFSPVGGAASPKDPPFQKKRQESNEPAGGTAEKRGHGAAPKEAE